MKDIQREIGQDHPPEEVAEPVDNKEVVFITIFREDRGWINATKGELNRQQRLHEIIAKAKELEI